MLTYKFWYLYVYIFSIHVILTLRCNTTLTDQKLPAISFWDLNPPGGCLRHEIGTVPSVVVNWLFVDCSVEELLIWRENAEFAVVFDALKFAEFEFGGTSRTKAVVGDGISSTSTCWPRLTVRSPGQLEELTWSAITHVVVVINSQLWKNQIKSGSNQL